MTVTRIVEDPTVMSGEPTVEGTRVLAESVVAYLRAGHSLADIHEDFPTLPTDGIEAVIAWALEVHGADWRDHPQAPAP